MYLTPWTRSMSRVQKRDRGDIEMAKKVSHPKLFDIRGQSINGIFLTKEAWIVKSKVESLIGMDIRIDFHRCRSFGSMPLLV